MKTPECPGNCAACGRCPFAETLRPGSTLQGEIVSFYKFKLKTPKAQSWQNITAPVRFGGPVPGVPKESRCTCGFCSECRKKKIAA